MSLLQVSKVSKNYACEGPLNAAFREAVTADDPQPRMVHSCRHHYLISKTALLMPRLLVDAGRMTTSGLQLPGEPIHRACLLACARAMQEYSLVATSRDQLAVLNRDPSCQHSVWRHR